MWSAARLEAPVCDSAAYAREGALFNLAPGGRRPGNTRLKGKCGREGGRSNGQFCTDAAFAAGAGWRIRATGYPVRMLTCLDHLFLMGSAIRRIAE
jgi:hypothetical protein